MINSTTLQITLARRYFEYYVSQGYDMSAFVSLRTNPAQLDPSEVVRLAEYTGDDLGTLFSHGIGVNHRISDYQGLVAYTEFGTFDPKKVAA